MKDHAVTAVIGILTLIIGTLLGYYVDLFKEEKKNQIQYIDVRTETNKSILRKLSTKNSGEVNLTWNGNLIDSVSKAVVDVYNFSDKDFEKVPLFLELSLESGNSLEIIDVQGEGDSGIEDHIEITGYPQSKTKSDSLYGIEVGIINRATSYKPSYRISFLLKGSEAPQISAQINKKGIKSQEFTRYKFEDKSFLDKYGPIALAVIFAIAYMSFFVWFFKHTKKRRMKEYGELVDYLVEHIEGLGGVTDSAREKSKHIVQSIRVFRWNKLDKFDKFVFRQKQPTISELEEELTRKSSTTP